MKITKMVVHGYKYFKFSKHPKLEISNIDEILLIGGKNGVGKSTLFQALLPYPAKPNDYSKTGFKELTIIHNNIEYILTSDFSNKNHIHSFLKNNEELNISGLSTIQEELIIKELGYTPIIYNVSNNKPEFCQMTKAERKSHILSINPFDLNYFSELHKKTLSKIKECKTNIKMLHSRQSEIETRLVDKSILEYKLSESNKLNSLKINLDKVIFTISQYIKNYREQLDSYPDVDFNNESVTTQLKKIDLFLFNSRAYPRDISVSESELLNIHNQIEDIEKDEFQQLIREIDKHEEQLKTIVYSEHLSDTELETKIQEYKKILSTLKIGDIALSAIHIVPSFNETIEHIDTLVSNMSGYQIDKFISMSRLRELHSVLRSLDLELSKITSKIEQTSNDIQDIRTQLLHIPKQLNPIDQCDTCDIFNINKSQKEKLEKVLEKHQLLLVQLNNEYCVVDKRKVNVARYLEKYEYYSKIYHNVVTELRGYNLFTDAWYNSDLVKILTTSPMALMTYLNDIVTTTINLEEKIKLDKQLEESSKQLEELKIMNKTSKQFIEQILTDKYKAKERISNKLDSLKSSYSILSKQLNVKNIRNRYTNELQELKTNVSTKEKMTIIEAELLYCLKLEEFYTVVSNSLDMDLRELSIFIREQTSLRDRYENEITPLMQRMVSEQEQFEKLEIAISPTKGIPQKYLIKNINNCIQIVNNLIAQVWDYPLTLDQISDSNELDFVFSMKADDEPIPDISCGSTGQRKIIDFAWNMASMIVLRAKNYPLFMDEQEYGLDAIHKAKFLELLKVLSENKMISQLYLISHEALISEGFSNGDIVFLGGDNIPTRTNVNEHVKFK